MTSLNKSKALVTGSSRGIGRAIAILLAEAGADVAIHYHSQKQAAVEVAKAVEQFGRQALVIRADLENPEDRAQMFAKIEDQWGSLNILVASAAATSFKPLTDLKPYHLHRTYAVVVESFVDIAQRALPLMRLQSEPARIIAISSLGSHYTLPRYANIGSAKAALESMVRYVAQEFGRYRITCNAVAPGVVATDSSQYYAQEYYAEFLEAVTKRTPMGRLVTDADVAKAVLFFAGAETEMITGQILELDGGAGLSAPGFDILPPR